MSDGICGLVTVFVYTVLKLIVIFLLYESIYDVYIPSQNLKFLIFDYCCSMCEVINLFFF